MKEWFRHIVMLFSFCVAFPTSACIWDCKTLWTEKRERPKLADAILHPLTAAVDGKELTNRIRDLTAKPDTNNPAWWNDLAGAYLRLGRPAEAAKLLEPLTNKFTGDYGVHANLGTAYHLLGRYEDAEREIRRDTEINTNAHFGLEKYHLALLQYLSRTAAYRARHVYVEEFTQGFFRSPVYNRGMKKSELEALRDDSLSENDRKELEEKLTAMASGPATNGLSQEAQGVYLSLAMADPLPEYMDRWDLGQDPQLDDGVIYMASLNPKEPACQVMLGIVALKHWDIHLGKQAFENAIQLGSPQTPLLRSHIEKLNEYHSTILGIPRELWIALLAIFLVISYYVFSKWRTIRRKRMTPAAVQ